MSAFLSDTREAKKTTKMKQGLTGFHYFLIFWFINAAVIGVLIDIEQIFVDTVAGYDPLLVSWPPETFVRTAHWWGRSYDPALIERAHYYKFLVWIDLFYYIPFYLIGVWAILKKKEWIKTQIIIQQTALVTGTLTIMYANMLMMKGEPDKYMLIHMLTNVAAYSPTFFSLSTSFTDYLPLPLYSLTNNNPIITPLLLLLILLKIRKKN